MKPRTKIERYMCELADQLPPLSKTLVAKACELFESYAYMIPRRGRKTEVWCQHCGHSELLDSTLVEQIGYCCPSCGEPVEWRAFPMTRTQTNIEDRYVTLIDTFKGLQVVRAFRVRRANAHVDGSTDTQPTRLSVEEVFQCWAAPNGREVITTRPYTRNIYCDYFDTSKPYGIGRHNASYTGSYAFPDTYDLGAYRTFSRMKILPELKRDGFTPDFVRRMMKQKTNFIAIAARMTTDTSFVTMMKVGYQKLAVHIAEHSIQLPKHIVSILHRNRYDIRDVATWCDYMRDCIAVGVDTHNAHFVCPADLDAAHRQMYRRRERIEEQRRIEKYRENAALEEVAYQKLRASFLDLHFQSGDIVVFTAPSVASVLEEGIRMHHCVYQMGYYKREASLIMFARHAVTGERLETVEVNLRDFSIAQSRGLYNAQTDSHKKICALVNKNMPQIREAAGVRVSSV